MTARQDQRGAKESSLSRIPVPREMLARLVAGEHHDPHSILGAHPAEGAVTIRALRPLADRVTILVGSGDDVVRYEMSHEYEGVFVGTIPGPQAPDYRLEV